MLRQRVSDDVKLRIRRALARAGIEIGAYTGSFSEHRMRIIRRRGVETVWDVGAHIGQYAVQLQSHGYAGRIISIEPSEASFKELAKRAGRSDNWMAVAVAVADCVGDSVLNVAANGQSSSLLPMAERHRSASPNSGYVSPQPVKTTTLDTLQDRLKPAPPFFVKLDIQGGELAALRGAASVLRGAVACEVELSLTELYEGGANWQDVVAHLVADGLAMCDVERVFFDHVSGDLLQVNALFRRSS
jgi:FkbM family methyltransferase